MTKVISGLVVNPEAMKANIDKSYHIFFSQQLLLKLIEKGLRREDAYLIVQKNALEAFNEKVLFREKIDADPQVRTQLSSDELDTLFSFDKYTQHVDEIFSRVFSK